MPKKTCESCGAAFECHGPHQAICPAEPLCANCRVEAQARDILTFNDRNRDSLVIWTIYDGPVDYPERVVIRGQVTPSMAFTSPVVVDSIDAARKITLRAGLYCLGRGPLDEGQIVESWV
jgi:hypothetical protein